MTQEKSDKHFDVGDLRFYKEKYPEKEDLVMIKITRVTDMGAYVSLLEYNNLEGMVLMSELSKRRVRSIKKIVRVGRHDVVLVLRVDKEKGYIDLSKRRVSPEDVIRCEETFSRSKKVHQIMFHVAQKHALPLEFLNEKVTWHLAEKYNHALDAFQDPEFETKILPTLDISPEIRDTLAEIIKMRLSLQKMRMRVRVDLYCYGYDGVDAVRDAMIKGREKAKADPEDQEVDIKLIAPPQYMMIITCKDKADGEQRLTAAVQEMLKVIRSHEGGDGVQQGNFIIMGGEEERPSAGSGDNESDDEEDSEDYEEDEDEEEEDETMGHADQLKELGIPTEDPVDGQT